DPFLVAKEISDAQEEQKNQVSDQVKLELDTKINRAGIIVGALVLVLSHVVMVAVMTMTPIHMENHGKELSAVGLVIGLHIAAMYLPSIGTGVLVDNLAEYLWSSLQVLR